MATGIPNRIFQLGDVGRVDAGSRANFILLNSDPLTDITALRDVAGIWKNGTRVR